MPENENPSHHALPAHACDAVESISILFNTLPKSGSVSIVESLSEALRKDLLQISPGYFPVVLIDFRAFLIFKNAKGIAQSHLNPSEFNLRYISRIDKIILHLRDPRQSTLSWTHHLDRLKVAGQDEFLKIVEPALPADYFTLEFDKKLSYQITTYLPQSVRWIQDWMGVLSKMSNEQKYLITTHEDFVTSTTSFYAELFDFLAPGLSSLIPTPVPVRENEKNFRSGLTNEWKAIFSPEQIKLSCRSIPHELMERFQWEF